jgi:hypothetical protein
VIQNFPAGKLHLLGVCQRRVEERMMTSRSIARGGSDGASDNPSEWDYSEMREWVVSYRGTLRNGDFAEEKAATPRWKRYITNILFLNPVPKSLLA